MEIKLLDRGIGIIRCYASDLNLPAHDPELSLIIADVAGTVSDLVRRPDAQTHRVRLDALGIAISIFAIRSFAREVRRGQIPSLSWPQGIDRWRILTKLEKHRKRAKRKWLSSGDRKTYDERGQRWRRFLGWVRESLRPIHVLLLQDFYRRRLDAIVATVKRVLIEETNENLPDDRELRKLVRVMCRHIRRERAPILIKDILVCSDSGRAFITSYMVRLIARSRDENHSTGPVEVSLQSPLAG